MQAIYILWLRQLKKHFRSRSRMIGSLAQPLLFLVALGYGFGPVYQRAGEGNYLEFIAPGIIGMSIIFTSVFSGMEIIWDRQFGFLKETLVAPVSRFNIILGRTLGGATVATIQGAIVFILALIFGFRPVNFLLAPLALVIMLIVALLFTALGVAIASKVEDVQGFQLIVNFLVMPLFFLSGALFPLEGLPGPLAVLVRLDPLSYGIDALRGILIGINHFGIWFDFGIIFLIALALVSLGSWLFSKMEV